MSSTFYDPVTKKIIGAKRDTLTWWHEKGHMEYEKNPKCMEKDFSRQTMFKMAYFFIILALFINIAKWMALGFFIANIYYAIYEEVWAWVYAFKHKKKS